ncbi:FkbM family methyltransferase [Cesiribacter sp. SM1]|uniref:FkbM family methyltransferase n=1 Tax=Cesiribacter sp. SM1 TaxID=2861196 RepID=UPI001CD40500|nr:FkbM family methyltransferase [Cesiribacter sp. SM1]
MGLLHKLLNSKKAERFRRTLAIKSGLYFRLKRMGPSASGDLRVAKLLQHHQIKWVIDVGANTGQFAESLYDFGYQGRVVSFEPVSGAYQLLLERSGQYPAWSVAKRSAIGNFEGEIQIHVAADSVFSSILPITREHVQTKPQSRTIATETVPIARLDRAVKDYLPADAKDILLKIDTQGYEKEVLEGAPELLSRVKGLKLEIPLHTIYDNTKLTFYDTLEMLRKQGFSPYSIGVEGVDPATGRVNTIDGLFFRES